MEPSPKEARVTRRAVLGGAALAGAAWAASRAGAEPPAMPTRPFGATGRDVSVFGLGSFYVGAAASDEEGKRIVLRALDLGCTYVDTAPSYVGGASERRVGLALERRRDAVFLSTKTLERTRAAARTDLEESLRRLRTDHVDLVQVHCVRTSADLDAVLGPNGPLPALLEAKQKGQVRFVGVTGHEDPAVMRAAIERFSWDSVLLPLNPVDPHRLSFLEGALPAAAAKGIARVGMKVFASGRLVSGTGALRAEECLRFAYGLDVSCAIVGCSTVEQVEVAARAASQPPLSAEETKDLVARARAFSGKKGRGVEWYKRD
jgi:aryl-alcohol dehydrogenase-like predicted oxidoreductase